MTASITDHLLGMEHEAVTRATETHPFLIQAGQGTLTADRLARWLTQDRLYGLLGYTKLLGGMLVQCPCPAAPPGHPLSDLMWQRLRVLGGAMSNINREMAFFEDVAKRAGLPLDVTPPGQSEGLLAPATKGYIDYMSGTATKASFEESLVLLWSMEILYLKAWTNVRNARELTLQSTADAKDPAVKQALAELVPNWSSPEFKGFVDGIAELVEGIDESWKQPGSEKLAKLENVWRKCVGFEEVFWNAGVPQG